MGIGRLLVLSLCLGCIETQVSRDPDAVDVDDTDPGDGGVRDGELCNGRDDDGDGEVDEGWPDSDGDGLADCLERDCTVDLPPRAEIRIDPTCLDDPWFPPADPWDVVTAWRAETGGTGVVVMPAVGNLTDDNGDGFVDDRDVPEVVVPVMGRNVLQVRSGDTGALRFEVPDILGTAGVAIADVDRDGDNEIIAVRPGGGFSPQVVALEADGSTAWESRGHPEMMIYAVPVVGDLDGDGGVDVVVDRVVVDGATGLQRALLHPETGRLPIRSAVLGDVDLDGTTEIFLGPHRFGPDGEEEWFNRAADPSSVHTAIADVDGDPEGEILMLSGRVLEVYDPDGRRVSVASLPSDNAGPPCVADFDGDGQVELGLGIGDHVGVYELDGTRLWERRSVDVTAAHAGCSGYDFDGDGTYELLHADQHAFYLFDGPTGALRHTETTHTSTTVFEYPVVADVDGDGAAEIVYGSNPGEDRPGFAGVTVLEHRDDGWARSGATWGIHDFAVTNLGGDGSVPTGGDPPWLVHNVFRARPTVDSPALPDLTVELLDLCVGTCEGGPVRVSWAASNLGGAPVRPGTRVTVFRLDGFSRTPVHTELLPAIPPGTRLPAGELVFEPWELGDALLIEIDTGGPDAGGWVRECDEENNLAVLERNPCPGARPPGDR